MFSLQNSAKFHLLLLLIVRRLVDDLHVVLHLLEVIALHVGDLHLHLLLIVTTAVRLDHRDVLVLVGPLLLQRLHRANLIEGDRAAAICMQRNKSFKSQRSSFTERGFECRIAFERSRNEGKPLQARS